MSGKEGLSPLSGHYSYLNRHRWVIVMLLCCKSRCTKAMLYPLFR